MFAPYLIKIACKYDPKMIVMMMITKFQFVMKIGVLFRSFAKFWNNLRIQQSATDGLLVLKEMSEKYLAKIQWD